MPSRGLVFVLFGLLLACEGGDEGMPARGPAPPTPASPFADCTPGSQIWSMQFSPLSRTPDFSADAKWMVIADLGGSKLFDVVTQGLSDNQEILTRNQVSAVGFSPDGSVVGLQSLGGGVRLMEVENGKFGVEPEGYGFPWEDYMDTSRDFAFSPDGRLTVGVGQWGDTLVADAWNRDPVNRIQVGDETTGSYNALAVEFLDDSEHFVAVGGKGAFVVNALSGEVVTHYTDMLGDIPDVAVDGTTVVTPSASGQIHRWNAMTGELLGEVPQGTIIPGHAVDFARDGKRYAVGGEMGVVAVFDATNDQMLWSTQLDRRVTGVRFSTDNRVLLLQETGTPDQDDTLSLWCMP